MGWLPPQNQPAAGGPPPLAVEHVTLRYQTDAGTVTAVEDVSFTIGAGERLALLGPSGCGKSTLLRAVAGFLKTSSGEIRLHGAPVRAPGPDRMVVFQEFDQLLPWRTVAGNIAFALRRARGLGRAESFERARDWAGRVGLGGFADAYPHTLSGGMKQRCAIARAFAVQPAILLMDEPFAALDALSRRRMQDELLGLCEETGATCLFVTHAIDEALHVGTRVLVMTPHPGRIGAEYSVPDAARQRGTPEFGRLEMEIQQRIFGAALPETKTAASLAARTDAHHRVKVTHDV
ncbi:ABC transporter related protein [Ancylobacter novellus DSM 506]|uniref:ABC transporter related protein n=1 Tax=Ancylobacter novellus (strain ATCC 8093 / DSM 506 / JCM 20403 / CCM 1077 / IAM 12100 / NBRC 12443 / NCIMB 10456) TaxID=639283 RepID=D7A642_ANCN5|nr:ABC transporter ATP-binding protein [Ancylobacter novellus]ADH88192.1 ABC transporter related protein [Ancylobacter novellus DSM 506]